MPQNDQTIILATRGSALALAQANVVAAQCRAAFPRLRFELKIIKTTGDKLQTASLAQEGKTLPKGLFTKELEVALLKHRADIAVHSLKDLPTELPAGLKLEPKRIRIRWNGRRDKRSAGDSRLDFASEIFQMGQWLPLAARDAKRSC